MLSVKPTDARIRWNRVWTTDEEERSFLSRLSSPCCTTNRYSNSDTHWIQTMTRPRCTATGRTHHGLTNLLEERPQSLSLPSLSILNPYFTTYERITDSETKVRLNR